MQNPNIYSEITDLAKTYDELNRILAEVDILSASCFESSQDSFEVSLDSKVRNSTSEAIKHLLDNYGLDKQNLLAEIKKTLLVLSVLKLTLPFEPNKPFLDRIYAWVKDNLPGSYVLAINYDPAIIGGVVVSIEGKYLDCSLRKQFEENFKKITLGEYLTKTS